MTVTSMGAAVPRRRASVVVGVDDGLLRTRVLHRAVVEARRRDGTVQVVHVHGPTAGDDPGQDDAGGRAQSYLQRTAPDLEVWRSCPPGDVAAALADACAASSLLVVGDRHRRLGSEAGRITEELIEVAPCPVLVISEYGDPAPETAGHRSLVVVGVDPTPGASVVLLHALRAAEVQALSVEVVHAVGEALDDAGADGAARPEEAEVPADVDTLVATVRRQVPEVPVSIVAAVDRPARLLLERARGADLVVVGHRNRTAESLTGLGSTTRKLLLAAPCPVLVLGPRVSPADATGTTGTTDPRPDEATR